MATVTAASTRSYGSINRQLRGWRRQAPGSDALLCGDHGIMVVDPMREHALPTSGVRAAQCMCVWPARLLVHAVLS